MHGRLRGGGFGAASLVGEGAQCGQDRCGVGQGAIHQARLDDCEHGTGWRGARSRRRSGYRF